ncbi:MAG: hypothetical protein COB17_04600 [Sulfurimonas sp.]|nr:MAG: hypothetical protein COB17_04600 [Sulfurimonas sp.]
MLVKKLKNNMREAVIDQILLWMVLLIGFVSLLFITIDYSTIIRLKSNNDTLAQQAARLVALGRDTDMIADSLNNIKNKYYANISAEDIICAEVNDITYQVIFNVVSTYTNTKVLTFDDSIYSRVVVFNEVNSNEVTCTLTLSNN